MRCWHNPKYLTRKVVGHASDLRLTTFDGMEKLTVRWPKRTSTASRCQSGNLQEEKKKERKGLFCKKVMIMTVTITASGMPQSSQSLCNEI